MNDGKQDATTPQHLNLKTAVEIAAKKRKSHKTREMLRNCSREKASLQGETDRPGQIVVSALSCAFCAFSRLSELLDSG
jgi:hypothetical protein